MVKDTVNSVNAEVMAKGRGIKVTETTLAHTDEFVNLITVKTYSSEGTGKVAGTIFGQKDPRVVNINNFRLEMHPQGRFVLIHNHDRPGAIGSIGKLLGDNNINISRMRVGQEEGGDKTMIFLRTDDIIPDDVMEKLRELPLNITVTPFEL
jgi:D-3-phosphoglycerate dehydrogenase